MSTEWETIISLILYLTIIGSLVFTLGLYFVYKLNNKVKAPKTKEELDQTKNNKQVFCFAKTEVPARSNQMKIKKFAFEAKTA